jgi:hypothetical protein
VVSGRRLQARVPSQYQLYNFEILHAE